MRIPRPLRLLLALPFMFMLTGCISSYTLVKVNPTGAGTIEQTTMVSPMMVGMLNGMTQIGGEEGKKSRPTTVAELFKEEDLRNAATHMGQGVRFVSSKPARADGREGVLAIYAFDDVGNLNVNHAMKMPGDNSSAKVTSESPIAFAMTPGTGGAKVLSITMPEGRKDAVKDARARPQGAPDAKDLPPEALAMMKGMFQGAKIGIDIEVPQLLKSNSPHVTGSRVTLMELDLGAMMEDPAKLQQMQELGSGPSFEEARKVLSDVKGVKIPASRVTTIEFK